MFRSRKLKSNSWNRLRHLNPVPPIALGIIQGGIGGLKQDFGGSGGARRACDSDAYRQWNAHVAERAELDLLDCRAQPFRSADSFFRTGARHDDNELLATVASHGVEHPRIDAKRIRDQSQRTVA